MTIEYFLGCVHPFADLAVLILHKPIRLQILYDILSIACVCMCYTIEKEEDENVKTTYSYIVYNIYGCTLLHNYTSFMLCNC